MGFEAFRVSRSGAYCFFLIFCTSSCVGAIVLRFAATRRSSRSAGAEDWFALGATLAFLIRIGFLFYCTIEYLNSSLDMCCLISLHIGLVLINVNGRVFDPQLDKQDLEKIFKVRVHDQYLIFLLCLIFIQPQLQFSDNFLFFLDQTFAKFSIYALYRRIFSVNQGYRRWIYLLASAQFLVFLASVCIQLLQCRPIYKFWNFVDPGTCMPWTVILIAMEPPNSLVDFGLVVLAMAMIRPLRLSSRAKWKLRLLFGFPLKYHTIPRYAD